jgi:hypothetical protein
LEDRRLATAGDVSREDTLMSARQRGGFRGTLVRIALWVALPITVSAGEAEFTIEARDFDGGNARVSLTGQPYADGPSCIWNAGELPNWSEYAIEFPVTADYTLSALYAAAQARPVEIRLDEKKVYTGFRGVTGSWNTSSAR